MLYVVRISEITVSIIIQADAYFTCVLIIDPLNKVSLLGMKTTCMIGTANCITTVGRHFSLL